MINVIRYRKKYYFWLIFIMSVMSFLIFANINNSLLWKDEAIVANIGYNTLKYGYPIIWDGVNLISSTDGNSFNQLLIVSNYEWMQFYICAISFAIFGKTTFAARFPFAIFSLFSVLLIWFIAEKIFEKLNRIICCTLFYGLNVQFLLYSYQSRYYSLVLFGTALCILMVLKVEEKIEKKIELGWYDYTHLLWSTAFIFHSNRVSGLVIAIATILYLLYRYRKKSIKLIIPVALGATTWAIWYFINSIVLEAPSFGTEEIETHIFTKIIMILWKIQVYFFPFISLVTIYLLIELFSKNERSRVDFDSRFVFFLLIILINIFIVAIPRWGIVNHYFVPVLVVAPFFVTKFIIYCFLHSKYITWCFAGILLLSNILNIWPYLLIGKEDILEQNEVNNLLSENSSQTTNFGLISSPNTDGNFRIQPLCDYLSNISIRSYICEYLYEINHGTESYIDEAIQLLNKEANSDDTVLVLGFEYEPIIFYTNLRIVNNMTTRLKPWPDFFSEYPNQKKFEHLTIVEDDKIDWIIYKNDGTEEIMFENEKYLEQNASKFKIYETKHANVPLSNSPDLDYHFFSEVESNDRVKIYKRIE